MSCTLCLTFVTFINTRDLVLQVYCLLGAIIFSLHSFKVLLHVERALSTHLNSVVHLTPPRGF